jgi:hypothetical protein
MACGSRTGAKDSVSNRAELNRQTRELERLVTHGKQTAAIGSKRQKIKFCKTENPIASATLSAAESSRDRDPEFSLNAPEGTDSRGVLQFLTGTGSQTEMAVTHSKQKERTFLTGTRIARFDSRCSAIHSPDSSRSGQKKARPSQEGRAVSLWPNLLPEVASVASYSRAEIRSENCEVAGGPRSPRVRRKMLGGQGTCDMLLVGFL